MRRVKILLAMRLGGIRYTLGINAYISSGNHNGDTLKLMVIKAAYFPAGSNNNLSQSVP